MAVPKTTQTRYVDVREGVGHISAIDIPTQRGVAYRYSATHTVGL